MKLWIVSYVINFCNIVKQKNLNLPKKKKMLFETINCAFDGNRQSKNILPRELLQK
jgi:hypothetical protein